MKKAVSTAIIAAMLAGGMATLLPSLASAQEIQFNFGHRRPPPPDDEDDDDGPPPPPPPGYGYHRPPPPDFDRPPPGRGGCDPRQAVGLAMRNGFRRAHVVDVSPRRIVVDGFTRRGPDELVFGNVRGCPILD